MKITLFTSNNSRHIHLINSLSKISSSLNVVMESKTIYNGLNKGQYNKSKIIEKYFSEVEKAQKKIFKNRFIIGNKKNINILPISMGDLNYLKINDLKEFLKSDLYLVFGSSYIKGSLVKFLIKKRAINIHMGISPYYRGADCNFWALQDGNPHLVGATIHYLSEGLDSGDVLYHALAKPLKNPFEYTMKTVKSAINSVCLRIKNKSIFNLKKIKINKAMELRCSKKIEFDEYQIKKFFKKKINTNYKLNKLNYIKPFILD